MRPLQQITSAAPEAFYQCVCVCECEADATGVALRQTCVCVRECEPDAAGVAQHGHEQAQYAARVEKAVVCVCV
jgi:hypothetical protein